MANTDPKESGIHAWMASVRASMASDPCRQLFEDQLQTHAFIFLDDYLEHILAGSKQAPIIELVKTPGRKKIIPHRTRAATAAAAKVKNATLFSLDSDNTAKDVVPVNNFHKALLQAKERLAQDALEETHERSAPVKDADIPEVTVTVSVKLDSQAGAISLQHSPSNILSESSTSFIASEHGTALSVIAEGDESPERSHANLLPLSIIATDEEELADAMLQPRHEVAEYPVTEGNSKPVDRKFQEVHLTDARYPLPSSSKVYHLIPLGSPREAQSSGARAGNHTEPLFPEVAVNSPINRERNAFTAPLPVVPVLNSVPIPDAISVPLNDSSPRILAHKNGTAGFPMLPAPSPLRKSMRVAQEALTCPTLPAIATTSVPLGKRTSWLMKAREAKAMEGPSSLPSTSAVANSTTFPRASTAVKRKSGVMFGALPPGPDRNKERRDPKVPEPTENAIVPLVSKENEENKRPNFPSVQGMSLALSSIAAVMPVEHLESHPTNVDEQITYLNPVEGGFIDLFKRTVEGLGARAGKNMGRSLDGAAVAALAEARAAAEAKVAGRNKVNSEFDDSEILRDDSLPEQELPEAQLASDDQSPFVPAPQPERTERRLSLSDLAPNIVRPNKSEITTQTGQVKGTRVNNGDESTSTTPPDSPPIKLNSGFVKPVGPVFNKPPLPPVFMPPASKLPSIISGHPKEISFNFPTGQFTLPAAVSLGIPAQLTSPSDDFLPLVQGASQMSAQPSQSSNFSDPVFDKHNGVPMWVPVTQDAPSVIDSQLRDARSVAVAANEDDDDSWPLEEKLAAAEPGWRPFDFSNVDKEDTWSSLPTESQGPTRNYTVETNGDTMPLVNDTDVEVGMNGEEVEAEQDAGIPDAECSAMEVSELEDIANIGIAGLDPAEPTARGTRQTSMVSAAPSSQSQMGLFTQATKLVNSMLVGAKKAKPELKSLQLAAAAAKRQQEEEGKKMQRLKDMETRRQLAIAKKAEEERTRHLQEEKKSKEEIEKRKREREENIDRRPLKPPVSTKKAEDDTSKKRKLAPETEKKPESKKPPSKDKKDIAPSAKLVIATPATKLGVQKGAKASTTALASSAAYNATQNVPPAPSNKSIIPEAKPFRVVPSSLKGKVKATTQEDDMGDKLPSTVVQAQMAARAKAQMQAAKLSTPEVPSESIELPEINSEYSDSEDEDRVRTFDPPDWAQSPELRQALQMQSTVNPDDIFGTIRPLRMEEMFRTRQSRFRARTSSANWTGSDRLTVEEIREYERRMGFQHTRAS